MGGRALSFETRRVDKKTYESYAKEIIQKLEPFCKEVKPTRAYHNKEDFGDLDLLVNSWTKRKGANPYQVINDVFKPKEIFKNGKVYSFDYNDFQIDLILLGEEIYEAACFYFSFNDLNNFVGKIYHNIGFKFGHKGLFFKLVKGHYKNEFLLTRDPKTIYELIGLDYSQWEKGFSTKEDIFNFVISSPFFSVNYYHDSMMNHRTRVRDRKRNTFIDFRAFLKENDISKIYHPRPSDFFNILLEFPEKKPFQHIQRFYHKIKIKESIAKKFNGNHVMEWTGLEGKELGKFLGKLPKEKYAGDDWDKERIKEEVLEYHKKLNLNKEDQHE